MQIEAAPFPALMSLLVDLQQSGLRAEKAAIERNAKPGRRGLERVAHRSFCAAASNALQDSFRSP